VSRRYQSSWLSYEVDWSALDDAIDSGRFVRWIDDPAWRWYGSPYMDHVLAGDVECPVCFEAVVEETILPPPEPADGEAPADPPPPPEIVRSIRWINLRRPHQTCPYCLRKGWEERIPDETPPRHVAAAEEIKFKARIRERDKKLAAMKKKAQAS